MLLFFSIFGSDKTSLNKHVFLFKKYINIYLTHFLNQKNNLFFCYNRLAFKDIVFSLRISSVKPQKKNFVVLRSPHIFKKAKERFSNILFKYSITIDLSNLIIHNSLIYFFFSKFIYFFLNYYSVGFKFKLRFFYKQTYKLI